MIYLPSNYSRPNPLVNFGHFHGIKALNNQIPAVADITSRLSSLRRSDVLAFLCSLSGLISQPGNKEIKSQLRLSSELLPKELHEAYQELVRSKQNEIGGPGRLFHLQQIWFMIQMTLICCKEDSPVLPPAELRTHLAITCLMANDVIQEIDAAIRPVALKGADFNEGCIGACLPLTEVYGDGELLQRAHLLWFECAESLEVREKARQLHIEPDLEVAFTSKYHVSLREFFLFLFALRVHFQGNQIGDPMQPSLLETKSYLGRLFSEDFLKVALPFVTQTPEELAIQLLTSRQSWSSDISPLRGKPLVQVFDGKVCCPDHFLLFRTITEKIYLLLEDAYPAGTFRTHFGYIFQEYLSRIIDEVVPSSDVLAKRSYVSPKFEGTQQEASDCILNFDDVAVVMEWKSGRLTNRQKYGGGTEELVDAIKNLLASEKRSGNKGAAQLVPVLKQIMEGKKIVDKSGLATDALKTCHAFYPIIVTAEQSVGINCVRNVIQKEFDRFLLAAGCDTSRIKPLMILTVRDFEALQAATATKTVRDLLDGFSKYLETNGANPIGGFLEYLQFNEIHGTVGLGRNIEIVQTYITEIERRDQATTDAEGNASQ